MERRRVICTFPEAETHPLEMSVVELGVDLALAIAEGGNGALILAPEAVAHFHPATPEQLVNACYEAGFRLVSRGVIGDERAAVLRYNHDQGYASRVLAYADQVAAHADAKGR